MSKRWRIAGLVLAAIAFVLTLADPRPIGSPLVDAAPLALAALSAVAVFVWVWVMETVFLVLCWVWRRLSDLASD